MSPPAPDLCDPSADLFLEHAGVKLLRDIMEVVQEFVMEGILRTWPDPNQYELGRRVHMAIVDAIGAHDPDAADKALQAHMEILFGRLQKHQG